MTEANDRTGPDGGGAADVLESAVNGDDPEQGLRAVVALRALADQLELLHVERARDRGWSWQEIATGLGVSKQAVHKKYGRH